MKEYETAPQGAAQELGGPVTPYSRYSRCAQPLSRALDTPKNRDPYYYRKPRPRRNLDYGDGIPPGTGYPERRPVGSYI